MRGRLLTLEGLEGAGKSTQAGWIVEHLREAGWSVCLTREPGGTPLGEQLRALLLAPRAGGMSAEAELLMMFAARAEHLAQVIRPALAAGQIVVCDRFTDASYAYQGGGRALGAERVATLEHWLLGDLRPDRVLWFDVPVEVGLARAAARAAGDRFEREDLSFFQRVHAAYAARAAAGGDRYRRIDAALDCDAVRGQVQQALRDWREDGRGR